MLLKAIFAFVCIVAAIFALIALELVYDWLRRKTNKPKIGFKDFSSKCISKGDYVCINGKVREFDHWTSENEIINPLIPPFEENKTYKGNLAFTTNGLGYNICPSSILRSCQFIYGKYGLKWASSESIAQSAGEKVRQYKESY